MKKILLSIIMMALLAACGDSGSSPVAPASSDDTSVYSSSSFDVSKVNWNKYSSSMDEPIVEPDPDSIPIAVLVQARAVCDSFNVEAYNMLASEGGSEALSVVVFEFNNICEGSRGYLPPFKSYLTKSSIIQALESIDITMDADLLDVMLVEATLYSCGTSRILPNHKGELYFIYIQ